MAKYKATEKFFNLKDKYFSEGTIITLTRGGTVTLDNTKSIPKKVLETLETLEQVKKKESK